MEGEPEFRRSRGLRVKFRRVDYGFGRRRIYDKKRSEINSPEGMVSTCREDGRTWLCLKPNISRLLNKSPVQSQLSHLSIEEVYRTLLVFFYKRLRTVGVYIRETIYSQWNCKLLVMKNTRYKASSWNRFVTYLLFLYPCSKVLPRHSSCNVLVRGLHLLFLINSLWLGHPKYSLQKYTVNIPLDFPIQYPPLLCSTDRVIYVPFNDLRSEGKVEDVWE